MTAWALAPMLRSWRRQFPGVEIDLSEYTSADRMLETLLAGGADITVGPRPSRASQHTEVLGRVEVMVVAAPQYRFSAAHAVPLAEVAAGPLVDYHPGNGFGAWLDRLAARHGVTLPPPVLRTDSTRTAAQLAATGMGITLAPCSALTPLPEATVRSLDPPEFIDIVITIAAPHDHLIRQFAAALKEHGLPDSGLAPEAEAWAVIKPRPGVGLRRGDDDCARRAPGRRARRARVMTAEG
jgi:DNA-binding transcriptional LysR family regulator